MSGFDIQMKSDQQIAQGQQFYDAQRYQTESNTAQAIGQTPGLMQQARANEQAMEMQQLQSEMMRAKMDSDIRAQETATQLQFNQNKMLEMQQVDQLDMSRIGVEAARLGLRQQRLTVTEAEKAAKSSSETKRMAFSLQAAKQFTPLQLATFGLNFTSRGIEPFPDEKSREEAIARLKSADSDWAKVTNQASADKATADASAREYDLKAHRLALDQKLADIKSKHDSDVQALELKKLDLAKSDSKGKAALELEKFKAKEEYDTQRIQILERALDAKVDAAEKDRALKEREVFEIGEGPKYPQPGAPQVGAGPANLWDAARSLGAAASEVSTLGQSAETGMNPIDSFSAMLSSDVWGDDAKQAIANTFVKNRDELWKAYTSGEAGNRGMKQEDFDQMVGSILSDPGDRSHARFLRILKALEAK